VISLVTGTDAAIRSSQNCSNYRGENENCKIAFERRGARLDHVTNNTRFRGGLQFNFHRHGNHAPGGDAWQRRAKRSGFRRNGRLADGFSLVAAQRRVELRGPGHRRRTREAEGAFNVDAGNSGSYSDETGGISRRDVFRMKLHLLFILATLTVAPTLLAQEATPASSAPSEPKATEASPSASPQAGPPAELYKLDYDEESDVFSIPGTHTPYNGPVVSHGDNGKIELTGALKNGLREGHWTEYYEDGTPASGGNYRDNREVGPWKYWFENATLQCEGSYEAGKQAGVWKTYFDNGKPESEGTYTNGVKEGPWKTYDEKTGALSTVTYENGKPTP